MNNCVKKDTKSLSSSSRKVTRIIDRIKFSNLIRHLISFKISLNSNNPKLTLELDIICYKRLTRPHISA